MIQVAHVITRLTLGGSDQRLRDVVAAVPAHHRILAGPTSDPAEAARLREHLPVEEVPGLVRQLDPARDALALASLVRRLRALRPDVVHTHQAKGGLLGRLAARAANVPIVYHSASMASFGPGYGAVRSALFASAERVTADLVDRYYVVGHDLVRRLAANGVAPERLEVVRSGIDLAGFAPPDAADRCSARASLGLPPEGPVLCYVGSLEPRKGVRDLPELVSRVNELLDRPLHLVVAGDGPLRGELSSTCDPTRTSLLGHVPHVAQVMSASDALVLPSSAEGVPQVLVQAIACNLPFAAYDVDGVAELLGLGVRGRSVALGNLPALAGAVAALVDADDDRTQVPVGRGALASWSRETVLRQYRSSYEEDLAALSARRER